jgi:hypothetical protein
MGISKYFDQDPLVMRILKFYLDKKAEFWVIVYNKIEFHVVKW